MTILDLRFWIDSTDKSGGLYHQEILGQGEGINFPGVIYARQRRVSIGDCVRDLEIIAKVGHPEDFANRVQYLPL